MNVRITLGIFLLMRYTLQALPRVILCSLDIKRILRLLIYTSLYANPMLSNNIF
jgi:hypothetical protein